MARGIDVVRMYDLPEDELEAKTREAFAELDPEGMDAQYEESVREFEEDTILTGKVLNVVNEEVIVDIGYKSEGVIPVNELSIRNNIDPGEIVVLTPGHTKEISNIREN